jgi:hypothetical protein
MKSGFSIELIPETAECFSKTGPCSSYFTPFDQLPFGGFSKQI